jgi:hypothetical protein
MAGESTIRDVPTSKRRACSTKCVRAELANDMTNRSASTGFAKATPVSAMRKTPQATTTTAATEVIDFSEEP